MKFKMLWGVMKTFTYAIMIKYSVNIKPEQIFMQFTGVSRIRIRVCMRNASLA